MDRRARHEATLLPSERRLSIVRAMFDDLRAEDIFAAAERIAGVCIRTPLRRSAALSRMAGGDVLLKLECEQVTGSFKLRGAYNAIASLSPEVRAHGVVASSAGNHGLGVAWASKHLKVPAVVFVPVDAPESAVLRHYLTILDEVSQLHTVLSGDAVVSGKSREQARAEYVISLADTRPEAESALRFLLETPLAMAEALAGTPGALTSLVRIDVECRLDTGPIDPAERAANEASIGKTISQPTAMSRNGVDDIDAELIRMREDPLARAVLFRAQADALQSATNGGMSVETAAVALDLDPDLLKLIQKDAAAGAQLVPTSALGTGPKPDVTGPKPDKSGPTPDVPKTGAGKQAGAATTHATGGAVSAAGGSQ